MPNLEGHPFILKQMQIIQTCLNNDDFHNAAKNLRSIATYVCKFYLLKYNPDLKGCYLNTFKFPPTMEMCKTLKNAGWVDENTASLLKDMIDEGNKNAHPEGGEQVSPRVVRNSFQDLPDFLEKFLKEFPREDEYKKKDDNKKGNGNKGKGNKGKGNKGKGNKGKGGKENGNTLLTGEDLMKKVAIARTKTPEELEKEGW